MEHIRSGIDKLELSYRAHLPAKHLMQLEEAKRQAQAEKRPVLTELSGVKMSVAKSGLAEGYVVSADTGTSGEIWMFKRANERDPWGIRVSAKAFQTQIHGLHGTRSNIETKLKNWEIDISNGSESISRVDVSADYLYPDFVLDDDSFVAPARARKAKHGDLTSRVVTGRASVDETAMFGKMPGRQVTLYNKRRKVLKDRSFLWFELFNDARLKQGKTALDFKDETNGVWRVELRFGKRYLKQISKVTQWGDLTRNLEGMCRKALSEIRYVLPTTDTNRARRPVHPLWIAARHDILSFAFSIDPFADESLVREMAHEAKLAGLRKSIIGCYLSEAAIRDVSPDGLNEFMARALSETFDWFADNPAEALHKLERAKAKYP